MPSSSLKLEIARRQLGTALALHIAEEDPVSVHALACGGCEIAEQLALDAGSAPFRSHTLASYPGMTLKQHRDLRNRYWNAIKHAQTIQGTARDDDQLMGEFSVAENDVRLFTGWSDYSAAGGLLPLEAQVFNTWFLALDLGKFAPDFDQDFIRRLESEFPGLGSATPGCQRRMLRMSIARWRQDQRSQGALTDPRPLKLPWP